MPSDTTLHTMTKLTAGELNGHHLQSVILFEHDGAAYKGFLTDIVHTDSRVGYVYVTVEPIGQIRTEELELEEHTRVTVVP